MAEWSEVEKDANAAIKQIMSEVETAAKTPPAEALHPYSADLRRKIVIRTIWHLVKRCIQAAEHAAAESQHGDASRL